MRGGCQIKKSPFPIAIIGIAFRFPGDVADEAELWRALKQKSDLVTEIPADRWAVNELQHNNPSEPGRSSTFSAGVLSRIDEFDAGFFGISPREAAVIDPQQRLLLELAWKAMENAGIPSASLAGSDCAVYVGISNFDYAMRGLDDFAAITSHSMTGNTLSIAANRISYIFDLRGPSLAVDTACSSSLVALHHACNALRNEEASSALVGGVNLLLHPNAFIGFTKASMLSPDGRCKPFDAEGDGYVRSEGGAVLLLKPLEKALADGDNIQAVILGSGVNADGAQKTGITIPSSEAQAELMREVLARSGLAPKDVDFIEAHGTGTAVGDPVETAAIGAVYGTERATPLPIGSVKGNLGHLESAAGMAGLVKAVLALKHRALPPALHLQTTNPRIDFHALNLEPVNEYKVLDKANGNPLVAGVNSFGFGGANAHVLLQEFIADSPEARIASDDAMPPLLLSARSEAALRAVAQCYAELLLGRSEQDFYDIAYSAAFRRDRMEKRLVVHAASCESAVELLKLFAEGGTPEKVFVEDSLSQGGGVAFVYSGNGAQWVGMGRMLFGESQRFAEILTDVDVAMLPHAGFSVVAELHADDANARLDDTAVAQPLLFAVQVAVTILLKELGIEPAAVTGHSVGEVAAAWASGALDLDQAVRVICARSHAQAKTRGQGRMAALGLSVNATEKILAELEDDLSVEISGVNSPHNVTLSGDLDVLIRIQKLAEQQGIFFRLLDLDYAFHSRQMDPIEGELTEQLGGLASGRTKKAVFVSTVTGDEFDGAALDAGYWWRNIREPVQFSGAVAKLAGLGCRVFIEIGPNAILQRYISDCLTSVDVAARVMPSLRRDDDGVERIVETALRAQLVVDRPQLQAFFPHPGRPIRLPNYPWQKERHWYVSTSESLRLLERRRVHPLLGWRLRDADVAWENTLDPVVLPWLADHKVGDAIVYPGAAYAEMACAAAREWLGKERIIVEQLDIVAPIVFDGEHSRSLRFVLNPRDGGFEIKSRQRLSNDDWTLHAAGRVLEPSCRISPAGIEPPRAPTRQLGREAHYRLASILGLDYGPCFQGLRDARVATDRLEADLKLPESLCLDDYLLHPALLDACFQSLVDLFCEQIEAGQAKALLPVKIGRLELSAKRDVVRLRARLCRYSPRSVLADFELLDEDDNLVARAVGCRFRAAHIKRPSQRKISNWRVVPWLKPHPADGVTTDILPIADLAIQARAALGELDTGRRMWFSETLPLAEALTLSFTFEAFKQLSDNSERLDLRQFFARTDNAAYVRWLVDLMSRQGLLRQEADQLNIVADADLPVSEDLWQSLLRDCPACLPQLTMIGRVGRQLSSLLRGETKGHELLGELQQSPVVDELYSDDPAYLGSRVALEAMLRHIAAGWPESRRLRILEIAAGSSELPRTLISSLPEDRFDYVLAMPNGENQERQVAEYGDHANIAVVTFDAANGELTTDEQLPDAFDIVIFRHALHREQNPAGSLEQARRRLAGGGLLLLAERHPDWSANLLGGIDPVWWRENQEEPDASMSPLMLPETWRQVLNEAGFVDCEIITEPAGEGLALGAYLLAAQNPIDEKIVQPPSHTASWVLLADEASAQVAERLCVHLESLGQRVIVTDQMSVGQCRDADHIVRLAGWNDVLDNITGSVCRLLADVQMLVAQSKKTPRLWLITRGGALATDLPIVQNSNPSQSAVWGFGRVAMNECPQLSTTLIDLACDVDSLSTLVRLENEFLRPDGANEIVLSDNGRYCLVMREERGQHLRQAEEASRFRLDFDVPGQLRNLTWLPETERPLRDDEIEVRTRVAGLNFRDVMYLMGLLPDEAVENGFAGASLGLEFSGEVSRVGRRVKDLLPGDAVMGFGSSCFASHVITRADAVIPMPEGWTFEAAATVPTVFFTVYYTLKHLADLQPGERVLIHGAAGGVGVAAIQIARHLDAEIYATAGSDEKRDFVALLGADHVFDSRSLEFADDILAATAGEGVDVVLNSLAGEAMRRSLDVLKPFGRFLELGKRDFFENTPVGLRPFKNNISYFGIDADQLLTGRPQLAARLFREVAALFRDQAMAPLPYRSFSADRIVDAFRVMQQARHIGKVVVSLVDASPYIEWPAQAPEAAGFKKGSTWLVTGGLSGFGLESARWLAARGVDNLVLVGRRGMDTPGAGEIIDTLEAQGVKVHVETCDVTDFEAVTSLIERVHQTLPPFKGILHAATVFDDRLIAELDSRSIENVLGAKLAGAWHLHLATLDIPLEYFVLYSSFTTAIGNPGQANYVAANAGLEGLAAMRRHMGLPATCIAWGAISDAGYLLRNEAIRDSLEQRLGKPPMASAEALRQLDRAFVDRSGFVMPANFDWDVLARVMPSADSGRFDILNRDRQDQALTEGVNDIRSLIAGKSTEEIASLLRDIVVQEVAHILYVGPDRIDPDRSLHDLGMDSLMAVELALGLERRFGIQLPVMMLNDTPTANNVTAHIVKKLTGEMGANEDKQPETMISSMAKQHGEDFSQKEIEALQRDMNGFSQTGTSLSS